jgi:CO/xanthine dehydrogenase Mo-binding subunit
LDIRRHLAKQIRVGLDELGGIHADRVILEAAMKKQAKHLKQTKKLKRVSWLVRTDRRRGTAIAKLPSGSAK